MKLAVFLSTIVPYHEARWRAVSEKISSCDLVEITDRDAFRVLECKRCGPAVYRRNTLFPGVEQTILSTQSIVSGVENFLYRERPDVLVLNGWSFSYNLAALRWGLRNGVPSVVCSESNENDEPRWWIKEFIKRRILSLCSAGLAGGTPQADYLKKLGMPGDRVFWGYDVVDNSFFETEVARHKANAANDGRRNLSAKYFFACARFEKKKNLPGLIRAFARYRRLIESRRVKTEGGEADKLKMQSQHEAFDLLIAGDGELRPEIERTIKVCGLENHVQLLGPKTYEELPEFYANAAAFIHASTTEQWGLVVNEAMASGLPVLVSNRCGCATDLVQEGRNGWTFDPSDEDEIAELMVKISGREEERTAMGEQSRQIIAEWGAERFVSGLSDSIQTALSNPMKKPNLLDRIILWAMFER